MLLQRGIWLKISKLIWKSFLVVDRSLARQWTSTWRTVTARHRCTLPPAAVTWTWSAGCCPKGRGSRSTTSASRRSTTPPKTNSSRWVQWFRLHLSSARSFGAVFLRFDCHESPRWDLVELLSLSYSNWWSNFVVFPFKLNLENCWFLDPGWSNFLYFTTDFRVNGFIV